MRPCGTQIEVPPQLTGQIVPLEQLWGADVTNRLADEFDADPRAAVRSLERELGTRLATGPGQAKAKGELVRAAMPSLTAGERVGAAASRLHISERRLRTVFTDVVGVPPKAFSRIARVRAVLAGAADRGLAQVASEAGYYDQSHMTTEFRDVMGVPPGEFIAGRLPSATPCPSTVDGVSAGTR